MSSKKNKSKSKKPSEGDGSVVLEEGLNNSSNLQTPGRHGGSDKSAKSDSFTAIDFIEKGEMLSHRPVLALKVALTWKSCPVMPLDARMLFSLWVKLIGLNVKHWLRLKGALRLFLVDVTDKTSPDLPGQLSFYVVSSLCSFFFLHCSWAWKHIEEKLYYTKKTNKHSVIKVCRFFTRVKIQILPWINTLPPPPTAATVKCLVYIEASVS